MASSPIILRLACFAFKLGTLIKSLAEFSGNGDVEKEVTCQLPEREDVLYIAVNFHFLGLCPFFLRWVRRCENYDVAVS